MYIKLYLWLLKEDFTEEENIYQRKRKNDENCLSMLLGTFLCSVLLETFVHRLQCTQF